MKIQTTGFLVILVFRKKTFVFHLPLGTRSVLAPSPLRLWAVLNALKQPIQIIQPYINPGPRRSVAGPDD